MGRVEENNEVDCRKGHVWLVLSREQVSIIMMVFLCLLLEVSMIK